MNRSRKNSRRRGAVIVEMALILPIFFLVVLGIVEFGRAMMVSNLITNSAREGCRLAILDGTTNTQVETAVKDFLQSSVNVAPTDVTVTITVTPADGNPDPGNQVANAQSRDLITVRVAVPFAKVQYIPSKYLGNKILAAQSSMRHE